MFSRFEGRQTVVQFELGGVLDQSLNNVSLWDFGVEARYNAYDGNTLIVSSTDGTEIARLKLNTEGATVAVTGPSIVEQHFDGKVALRLARNPKFSDRNSEDRPRMMVWSGLQDLYVPTSSLTGWELVGDVQSISKLSIRIERGNRWIVPFLLPGNIALEIDHSKRDTKQDQVNLTIFRPSTIERDVLIVSEGHDLQITGNGMAVTIDGAVNSDGKIKQKLLVVMGSSSRQVRVWPPESETLWNIGAAYDPEIENGPFDRAEFCGERFVIKGATGILAVGVQHQSILPVDVITLQTHDNKPIMYTEIASSETRITIEGDSATALVNDVDVRPSRWGLLGPTVQGAVLGAISAAVVAFLILWAQHWFEHRGRNNTN